MKKQVRASWLKRVTKELKLKDGDKVFEIDRQESVYIKPTYEMNGKLYIVTDVHGRQL